MAVKNMVSIAGYSKFVIVTPDPQCILMKHLTFTLQEPKLIKHLIRFTVYATNVRLTLAACQNLNITSQNYGHVEGQNLD